MVHNQIIIQISGKAAIGEIMILLRNALAEVVTDRNNQSLIKRMPIRNGQQRRDSENIKPQTRHLPMVRPWQMPCFAVSDRFQPLSIRSIGFFYIQFTYVLPPLGYHNLMKHNAYYAQYHEYFDYLIESYFESGYFEDFVADTTAMIAPYVEKDPTAFCSFEEWQLGVDTIKNFCLLRSESIRGQLDGSIPSTIAAQAQDKSTFVDASMIRLPDMGEIADLKDGYH